MIDHTKKLIFTLLCIWLTIFNNTCFKLCKNLCITLCYIEHGIKILNNRIALKVRDILCTTIYRLIKGYSNNRQFRPMGKLTYRIGIPWLFLSTIWTYIRDFKKSKLDTKVYKSHPNEDSNGKLIILYSTDEAKIVQGDNKWCSPLILDL